MSFYQPAEAVIWSAVEEAMTPPPPPDITAWCEANVEFDSRSPLPGPFDITQFPFFAEIHEVLSPDHPCREVTLRASAQIGKTVTVICPFIAVWAEHEPCDSLVVHPTSSSAAEFYRNKWLPMRRTAPALREVFGPPSSADSMAHQEAKTKDRTIKITSAGSPDDLSGTSRRVIAMDDLAKFENLPEGDPESMSVSRASGFEDAKILRVSTPQVVGTCRISKAYAQSDARLYDLPCPHCGTPQPLEWQNFQATIDPENLAAAHFTCIACGEPIRHAHKMQLLQQGQWRPTNPAGDHPGFHLWRAYSPLRDWHSIALDYSRLMGWTSLTLTMESARALAEKVDAAPEQTFRNDVLGLPYEQATGAPPWETLRDRTEAAEDGYEIGRIPEPGIILTIGVDCQDDRTEAHFKAFGRNARSWTLNYRIIPYKIDDVENCWPALDALLVEEWRLPSGQPIKPDMLAIDEGNWQSDVRDWAKRFPASQVISVRGQRSAFGPSLTPMQVSGRRDKGNKRNSRPSKSCFMVNVSQLKAEFYNRLEVIDPLARGFCAFPRGIGDEFYRQITAERREVFRSSSGTMESRWILTDPTARNEGLDTEIYAEAAAIRKGWRSLTDQQWDALAERQSEPPADGQGDLFDGAIRVAPLENEAPATQPQTQVKPNGDLSKRIANLLDRMPS